MRRLGTKIITVRVGEAGSTKDFSVHEELVRANSPFFEAALGREWKEAVEGVVTLPDDNPEIFGIYVQWLYCGQIFSQVQGKEGEKVDAARWIEEWNRLDQCYALGDKLQDTDFKDCIVDASMEKTRWDKLEFLGFGPIIYTSSAEKSPVRKLPVELALRWPDSALEKYCIQQRQPHDNFTADLMLALSKRTQAERNSPCPYWSDPCRYHEHTPLNKPCHKTKRGLTR